MVQSVNGIWTGTLFAESGMRRLARKSRDNKDIRGYKDKTSRRTLEAREVLAVLGVSVVVGSLALCPVFLDTHLSSCAFCDIGAAIRKVATYYAAKRPRR